jgi:copper(I)-binding protein
VKYILIFVLMAFSLSACGAEQGIEVRDAWMRPAAQGENGAIYFVIQNRGSDADTLTGVSSNVAEAVEMHETTFQAEMSGDVMQMQQLDSVPLEPSSELNFEPGGLHVMLVGLKEDLKVGDEVGITMHFANFEDINVTVPVSEMPVSGDHSAQDH